MFKKRLIVLLAATAPLCLTAPAGAQVYPAKPIRLIVPSSPGGGTDLVARIIAQDLGNRLNTTVIVDNRPGVSGMFGTGILAKSAPDGYTIGMAQPALVVGETLYPHRPYNAERDLAPVILANESANVLAVHPALPANTLKELVALAKTKPINAGCNLASIQHLLTEMINQSAGVDIHVVPYKGGGLVTNDLVGGRIEMMWSVLPLARPFIESGKLRAIVVASAKRSPFLPNVPTTAESGWPSVTGTAWNGVIVPSGTPKQIVSRLNSEIGRGMSSPEARERYRQLAMEPFQENTPEEFHAFLRSETAKWRTVIQRANIKAE